MGFGLLFGAVVYGLESSKDFQEINKSLLVIIERINWSNKVWENGLVNS